MLDSRPMHRSHAAQAALAVSLAALSVASILWLLPKAGNVTGSVRNEGTTHRSGFLAHSRGALERRASAAASAARQPLSDAEFALAIDELTSQAERVASLAGKLADARGQARAAAHAELEAAFSDPNAGSALQALAEPGALRADAPAASPSPTPPPPPAASVHPALAAAGDVRLPDDPLGAADVPALPALAGARTLTVGIPSVPRAGGEDYLARTLKYIGQACATPADAAADVDKQTHWFSRFPGFTPSLLEEECLSPGPHALRLRVVAMNNARVGIMQHAVWEAARLSACSPSSSSSGLLSLCAEVSGVGGPHTLFVPVPRLSSSASAAAGAPAPAAVAAAVPVAVAAAARGWPRRMVVFAQNGRPVQQDGEDGGTPNVPGARVRRQTRDVVDLLDAAAALMRVPGAPTGPGNGAGQGQTSVGERLSAASPSVLQLYMAAEDDFRLCPSGLESLAYLVALADERFPSASAGPSGGAVAPVPPGAEATGAALAAVSGWNALRLSFGLNGAIIHGGDAPVLSAYLNQHQARRPPDHLLVEWFAGEKPQSSAQKAGRAHAAFRFNLLEHFGHASSLRAAASPLYAFCYDELNSGVVFEVEAFKNNLCPADDIWPCPPAHTAHTAATSGVRITARVPFAALKANARADSVQKWAIPGAM